MPTEVNRRTAIGGSLACLMSPFIPALKVHPIEPAKPVYAVELSGASGQLMAIIVRDRAHFKDYDLDSVAGKILTTLFDEEEYRPSDLEWGLLDFLWERHDHEAITYQDEF